MNTNNTFSITDLRNETRNKAQLSNTAAGLTNKFNHVVANFKATIKDLDEICHPILTVGAIGLLALLVYAEVFFSYELYRVIMKSNPFVVAIGLIGIGFIISEIIKPIFPNFAQATAIKLRKKHPSKLSEEIEVMAKRQNIRNIIIGLILLLLMSAVIFYFSYERVQNLNNVSTHDTDRKFGFTDALPVLFYIGECFTGMFLFHLVRRMVLAIKCWFVKRKAIKALASCKHNTQWAYQYYEELKARQSNYEPCGEVVKAIYRYQHRNAGERNYTEDIDATNIPPSMSSAKEDNQVDTIDNQPVTNPISNMPTPQEKVYLNVQKSITDVNSVKLAGYVLQGIHEVEGGFLQLEFTKVKPKRIGFKFYD